jgi:hypothetical protein
VIQLPFNQAMAEGFTRFNQLAGDGGGCRCCRPRCALGVYAMASHTLLKGRLSARAEEVVRRTLPSLANDAQRAPSSSPAPRPASAPPSWASAPRRTWTIFSP